MIKKKFNLCNARDSNELPKNYNPLPFFHICSRLLNILSIWISYNLLVVEGGDTFINWLLSITHSMYHPLDNGFGGRAVFFDISEAFDQVRHKKASFRLKSSLKSIVVFLFEYLNWAEWKEQNGKDMLNVSKTLKVQNPFSEGSNCIAEIKLGGPETSDFNWPLGFIELNSDLGKVLRWSCRWRMRF